MERKIFFVSDNSFLSAY